MSTQDERLLRYYWQELQYLRQAGERFARTYPKVAARLELEADESADPHVERLIESFAFLTGRIQSGLDEDFPQVAAELLDILYPHLLQPIPSLSIARFDLDPERGRVTSGFEVARGARLFAHSEEGHICRFRTCYPVTLWPVEVAEACFEPPDRYAFLDDDADVATVLRLRLAPTADPLAELEMDRLRLYLHGDRMRVGKLYELLFNHTLRVALLADGAAAPRLLPADSLRPAGFADDESVLPYPEHAQPAYRLLQEYFAFPEKFHFVDLAGLAGHGAETRLDVLLLLDRAPEAGLRLSAESFVPGCTPVINLFARTSEPIRVDHRQLEYRLVADRRREKTTEIHSVLEVSRSAEPGAPAHEIAPFYSFDHAEERRGQRAFWHAQRVPALRPEAGGTDVLLSFLDLDFDPARPPAETVFAHTLCTNRALAEQVPAGGLLQTDEAIPARRVVCLKKPTPQVAPPLGGQTLWRLVSHLSLNYLSLTEGRDGVRALREILRLYTFTRAASIDQQINGIRALEQTRVVRRLTGAGITARAEADAWRGFCRGTEVTLTLDESLYVGGSAFLFATVLSRFLGLYASTNSFTQLVLKSLQRDGEWKRWPPMAGSRQLL